MQRQFTFKTIRCVAAIGMVIALSAATGRAAIVDGLVSYWPLDGNFGDTASGNNGTLMGADTTANFDTGKFGGGIDLDGVDQFVEIGGDEADYDFEAGDLSISTWFRVDGFTKDWQALIAKGEGSRWRVARRGGDQEIAYAGGSGEGPASGLNVNDGALHHMVAISENGVSTRLWVDGVLQSTGGAPNLENGDMQVQIGGNPDTGNRTWDGLIDDVAIWGRVLTPVEIGEIWNGGAGNSIQTLLGGGGFVDGDVNGDGVADLADYMIIRDNFSNTGVSRPDGDLDFNGEVNLFDFVEWRTAFEAAPAAAVPEPAAMLLLAAGLACFGCTWRRFRPRS